MNPMIEKKLFDHIDRELYNEHGFIDYKSLKDTLQIKVKDIANAVGVTPRSLEKNPKSERVQSSLRKIAHQVKLLLNFAKENVFPPIY